MVSFMVLAAGESSRFGSPKSLASWNGQPLINHLLYELVCSQTTEIIVVLGHEARAIESVLLKHAKIKLVYNKNYKLGQTSSIKCGIQKVSPSAIGVGLLPVDFPRISTKLIDELITFFTQNPSQILIPTHLNRKGHPPIFGRIFLNEIANLSDEVGLNSLFAKHLHVVTLYPVPDPAVLASFNTPEEFNQIREKLT